MLEFREITYGSAEYRQTLDLRERVLRIPIGLVLSSEDTINEDRQRHFVILENSDLVACVVIKPLDVSTVKLRQMAVLTQCQGRDIGRQLILAVEKALNGGGITHVEMSARLSATGFYEKLGYRVTGGQYVEQGIAHIRMQKRF